MEDMTSSGWQRRGSSVVFHSSLLGPLIDAGCLVSLREALGWMKAWPVEPCGNRQTVLVGGLETALEVLEPQEAEEFLRSRMKAFIHEFQGRWDQRGLVFGFGCPASRFQVDAFEDVRFLGPGQRSVRLSMTLWNSSARQDMYRILVRDASTGRQEAGGFYVRRLS